jgi:hypothetical protein
MWIEVDVLIIHTNHISSLGGKTLYQAYFGSQLELFLFHNIKFRKEYIFLNPSLDNGEHYLRKD